MSDINFVDDAHTIYFSLLRTILCKPKRLLRGKIIVDQLFLKYTSVPNKVAGEHMLQYSSFVDINEMLLSKKKK